MIKNKTNYKIYSMCRRKKLIQLVFIVVFLASCMGKHSIREPQQRDPFNIPIPSSVARISLEPDPEGLPEGAKAHLPAFDGDRFFVTLPTRKKDSVSSTQVLKEVIRPILKALRFERGEKAFSIPPSNGIKMPTANFKALMEDLELDFKYKKKEIRPKTREVLDTALGKRVISEEINQVLQRGEGMGFRQLVANIERQEIQYPFQQMVGDVPIEHTLILATRWQGQSVTSVRGVVFNKYIIANQNKMKTTDAAVEAAKKSLSILKGVDKVTSKKPEDGLDLLLLPYGNDATGKTILRYVYRMILRTSIQNSERPFLLWVDAENGEILKLLSLVESVDAEGMAFHRDPGTGVFKNRFDVDPAIGGQFTLQYEGLSNRIDYLGDGDPSNDLSIPDNTNGSSSILANFDQFPLNDVSESICASGSNKAFQQINFLASLSFYVRHVIAMGIFTPFPKLSGRSTDAPDPWSPKLEIVDGNKCNAYSSMEFIACGGHFHSNCPDYSTGFKNQNTQVLNLALDKTIVAHEVAHNITKRLTALRPTDWCGGPGTCVKPTGMVGLHDLADAWADHFESTNCTGGWAFKNEGGVNASLNCLDHNEFGVMPRLHSVSVPFDSTQPQDHFPEKDFRAPFPVGAYAHGQIAAAALWHIRLGMFSKSLFGALHYESLLIKALKNTGFLGSVNLFSYKNVYKLFYDLEMEMVNQWASFVSSGVSTSPLFLNLRSHTTNKVTAGFARAGLFLIPPQCLDGDPTTHSYRSCRKRRGGENGADAVIDIADNDSEDDGPFGGVVHNEEDYLELGGDEPTFHVWTGTRYRLDGADGQPTFNNPAPCNSKFRVEVSTDENFAAGSIKVNSPWIQVDTDPTTPDSPECYGTWEPSPAQWSMLQANGALTKIYYRARTDNAANNNRRKSESPGRLWRVPYPYATLTIDGQKEY